MSLNKHPFRWVPSLQHMAAIKAIEILWKNSKDKAAIKDACGNLFNYVYYVYWYDAITPTLKSLELTVNTLPVPKPIKRILQSFLGQMVYGVSQWLRSNWVVDDILESYNPIQCMVPEPIEEPWAETIDHFVDNIKWNQFGYIDDRRTLESFVRNKQTISIEIWAQLCRLCCEDDIIKFSKTMDWDNSKTRCSCPHYLIYWYYKIYGQFPPEKIFTSSEYCLDDDHNSGLYNEENMFHQSNRNISAIMYFGNHLKDHKELSGFISEAYFRNPSIEVAVHLLRAIENITFLECRQLTPLMKWPWILFIDDWISIFEDLSSSFFIWFFRRLGSKSIEPFSRQFLDKIDNNCTLYDPFQKVWRIFNERFISNDEVIREAFLVIFSREDVILCEIMFEGMASQRRKLLLHSLDDRNGYNSYNGWLVDLAFSKEFYKKVLKDYEDRKLFRKLVKQINDEFWANKLTFYSSSSDSEFS